MIDTRLLGTWQSDTRKTMREIRNRKDIPEANQKKLKSLFGKLRVRYTRARIHTAFKGDKSIGRYQVVAKDSNSVAIVAPGLIDEIEIADIHFEGNYYWICLGKFREYFKKED